MRMIDADDFGNRMYHEVFEKDSEDQKWDSGCWMRYKLFERVLREQPTIEPMRKKGRWKRRLVDSGFNADWHCSECGWETAIEEHGYNYCPNCGARMEDKK